MNLTRSRRSWQVSAVVAFCPVSKPPRRVVLAAVLAATLAARGLSAASAGISRIRTDDVRQWLTYIASDQLQGRGDYTRGLDQAAAYIEDHLRQWGVKPAGDAGSYQQAVDVSSVHATSRSLVVVKVGSETRTFRDGDGVAFPHRAGGKQSLTLDHVEFVGYGLDVPAAHYQDLHGVDLSGAAVVWLGAHGPRDIDGKPYQRLLPTRSRRILEEQQAAAVIGDDSGPESARGRRRAGPGDPQHVDFLTSERLDRTIPPSITGDDAFFKFLFSAAPVPYDELKRRSDEQLGLPSFRLEGVTITFTVDADYQVLRTDRLHNVIGVVEGTDPQLRNTYVTFGAHYDHIGSFPGGTESGGDGQRPPGIVTPGAENDHIWNGADDDGSGTVAVMALAKAFAGGPRPRRSLLFIWHAGEELDLYGSRYFMDHPTVPVESMAAELNIDMIGRNRANLASESNTVYLVGSDRISTELHAISQAANRSLPRPMTLDYELNDPSDAEEFYYRSDQHSYAAKGIPVIFFTTGLHPDYHANTDEVSRILFDKLVHVVQFVYETGVRIADLDHLPARDFKGARAGKGTR